MAPPMSIQFLGTSSAPNASRNYSSLVVKTGSEAVMVDCGEGTQRQMASHGVGVGAIHTILITHLHMDHVSGLCPLLMSMPEGARVDIYGPCGLRALIRTQLTLCYAVLRGVKYAVHELLWPRQTVEESATKDDGERIAIAQWDTKSSLEGAVQGERRKIPVLPRHASEDDGRDIFMDGEQATWPSFLTLPSRNVTVHAAPILHRCPTLAYVFVETPSSSTPLPGDTFARLEANAAALLERDGIRNPRSLVGRLLRDRETLDLPDGSKMHPPALDVPGRKIVVCGDTSDANGGLAASRGLQSLARNATVLVHECTNASMPTRLLKGKQKAYSEDEMRERARANGHSTPQVAGEFAGAIAAQSLLLNHFSVRYTCPEGEVMRGVWPDSNAPRDGGGGVDVDVDRDLAVLDEISLQATRAWHDGMAGKVTAEESDGDARPLRQEILNGRYWKNRRAIPTWDGFEYHVLRDDELRAT